MTPENPQPWPCDWEGAELQQLRRDAALSFREKLIWLEAMTEFAEKLARAPTVPSPKLGASPD